MIQYINVNQVNLISEYGILLSKILGPMMNHPLARSPGNTKTLFKCITAFKILDQGI